MATGQGTNVSNHSEPRGRGRAHPARTPPLPADVRTLDLAERQALRQQLDAAQRAWLPRLANLVEPPPPAADFPAFLLDTPPFAPLRAAIGNARSRAELATSVREDVQCFVDAFRDYLRTTQGEDAFAARQR